ncbi:MAG: hypothetical protein A2Y25_07745 [Candidatus Melainabacteria bacterium GWF2_37_15]|nr:MAG: hypothetical protein A2Y25_07745 [Candidatus Melainabacteria bacterium GWF2_37_15]
MVNTEIGPGLEVIFSAFLSVFIAQFIKFIHTYIVKKKFDFKVLATTGGMPSSHTSGTVALTTSVGLISGFSSVEFAIALGFTLIVMYDAAGLRRSAGQMAALLNKMVDDYYTDKRTRHHHERLMEVLGHTPFEVLVGALFGVFIAYFVHYGVF